VVLRLPRGESLDPPARETGQAARTIGGWREESLAAGREGLKSRPRPVEDRPLAEAQRKIGELALDNDILPALLEAMGRQARVGAPLRDPLDGECSLRRIGPLRLP
jgi:hypothetical protein